MNALILMLLLLAADDSPLVKAAKASGGPHKKTGKVITNVDVKKAAAKTQTTTAPAPTTPASSPITDTTGPLQKQAEQRRARVSAIARVANAEKKAAELEAELRRLEQAYYEESDLTRRDSVLVPRFGQTKKQLEEAKAELADARDALTRLE